MAQVLKPAPETQRVLPPGWWPADLLITGYLAATGLLILAYGSRVPGAGWLVALHMLGIALVAAAAAGLPRINHDVRFLFRHWYPLLYVAACYKEMAILIPAIRATDLDPQMARLDFALWGTNPTVWLERLVSPVLTELLQIVYSSFIPAVLLVAFLVWRRNDFARFRFCAFLIALGYLASFIGYFAVPVRGPRFFLSALQHVQLQGLWLFGPLQQVLDRLESAHYDCFPSGHTELTLLAWWLSRRLSKNLFAAYSVYSLCIVFATVYLRYHYTVDVAAGAALAAALWFAAPWLYGLAAAGRSSLAGWRQSLQAVSRRRRRNALSAHDIN